MAIQITCKTFQLLVTFKEDVVWWGYVYTSFNLQKGCHYGVELMLIWLSWTWQHLEI
jgi:hypothetical protein